MEKLQVEIELSAEELNKFDQFIEDGCFDKTKYLKKMLLTGVVLAGNAPKRKRVRGMYKTERHHPETETEVQDGKTGSGEK